jgi:hypothetical protein
LLPIRRQKPEEGTGQDQLRGCGTPTVRLESPVAREVLSFRNPVARQRLFLVEAGSSANMLSRCANSQCCKPFLKLREGKLFLVETERVTKPGESAVPPFVRARQLQRRVEHYWLCDDCATQRTLVYDRDRGVGLAPLRHPAVSVAAAAGGAHGGVALAVRQQRCS